MDLRQLLETYEATGDEDVFLRAKAAFAEVLPTRDPRLLLDFGYLLECHGRYTLRRAVEQYERAVELDPDLDKARYQLVQAKAALFDTHESIALYRQRVADFPDQVREYRLLATALLAAHEYRRAGEVVDAGLRLAREDSKLIELRGEVRAGLGDTEAALLDWRRAVELDSQGIGPLFSSAYLLEREGRIEQAIDVWQEIVAWSRARDNSLDVQWTERELARLRERAAGS